MKPSLYAEIEYYPGSRFVASNCPAPLITATTGAAPGGPVRDSVTYALLTGSLVLALTTVPLTVHWSPCAYSSDILGKKMTALIAILLRPRPFLNK
jgi:hypothetical protein